MSIANCRQNSVISISFAGVVIGGVVAAAVGAQAVVVVVISAVVVVVVVSLLLLGTTTTSAVISRDELNWKLSSNMDFLGLYVTMAHNEGAPILSLVLPYSIYIEKFIDTNVNIEEKKYMLK